MLPSASRKRVDDADAFNDLSVIHVFGQQPFATGGFSGADYQRIPERKLMKCINENCNNFFCCRAVSAISFNYSKRTSKEGKLVEVAGVEPSTKPKFAAKASKLSPDPFRFFNKFIHSEDG